MQQDWHPADIVAGLKKRGTSLAALSREAGLAQIDIHPRISGANKKQNHCIRDLLSGVSISWRRSPESACHTDTAG